MRPVRVSACAVLLLVFAHGLAAQVRWDQHAVTGRESAVLAEDPGGRGLVMFGGWSTTLYGLGDTLTWDGTAWTRHEPPTSPGALWPAHGAHDASRGRVVVFGSRWRIGTKETWEWDGTTWHDRTTSLQPPTTGPMAYDTARRVTTLFTSGAAAQTWEWDGTGWSQRPGPPINFQFEYAMAHDATRRQTVLTGLGAAGFETWLWDGVAWRRAFPISTPPRLSGLTMTYDAQRAVTVLVGAQQNGATGAWTTQTWEWDGTDWGARPFPVPPPARYRAGALAFSAVLGRCVLFGGNPSGGVSARADTWQWDGQAWRAAGDAPRARSHHAMVYDEVLERVWMFGGLEVSFPLDDTWEWHGTEWRQVLTAVRPALRWAHGAAFDAARANVVMFGGGGVAGAVLDDTWTWDGTAWTRRQPARSPSPRTMHAMTHDRARQSVVLFGGNGAMGRLADTWEWDGTSWQPRTPAVSPPADGSPAMVYDERRMRTVLFTQRQTWEWDGTLWTPRATLGPDLATMAYDPDRARIVGWDAASLATNQTWEWDGARWAQRRPTASPPPIWDAPAMAYDARGRAMVLFGGRSTGWDDRTWLYRPEVPATYTSFGSGCSGSAGVPALCSAASSWPWIGSAWSLELGGLAGGPAALATGVSRTVFAGWSLPLSLGAFGAPGCALQVGLDAVVGVPYTGQRAQWTISIPADPSLVGQRLYQQALVRDPATNSLGLVVSNANEVVLGAR